MYRINDPEFPAYFSRLQEAWETGGDDAILDALIDLFGRGFPISEQADVNVGAPEIDGEEE